MENFLAVSNARLVRLIIFRVAAYYQWLLLVFGREQMALAHR